MSTGEDALRALQTAMRARAGKDISVDEHVTAIVLYAVEDALTALSLTKSSITYGTQYAQHLFGLSRAAIALLSQPFAVGDRTPSDDPLFSEIRNRLAALEKANNHLATALSYADRRIAELERQRQEWADSYNAALISRTKELP